MPLRSCGSARRRRVALGALGPALVCRIVWLPCVLVGVAVPDPRSWTCCGGDMVVGTPVMFRSALSVMSKRRWLDDLVGVGQRNASSMFWKQLTNDAIWRGRNEGDWHLL
jgi:hypothetical protein